jgi:hypothetical protein
LKGKNMSATITWSVVSMQAFAQADGQTDVVIKVQWQCTGSQANNGINYFGGVYGGAVSVEYQQGEPFTPYDQLTEEQVLGWVWANGVNKTGTEAIVQAQIDEQINVIQES